MNRVARPAAIAVVAALAPAAPAAAAGGVIVEFEPRAGSSAVSDLLGSVPVVGRIYGTTTRVVRAQDPAALAARLNRSGLVRFAEVDKVLRASATPNDPSFAGVYGLDRINAPEVWDALGLGAFPTAGGVKVGIVDTANTDVEVAAPGVKIVSSWFRTDSDYNTISGTSMATPHVAGVAALIAQRFPAATAATLRTKLGAATDDLARSAATRSSASAASTPRRAPPSSPFPPSAHQRPPPGRSWALGAPQSRGPPRLCSNADSRSPSPCPGRSVAVTWRQ